MAKVAAHAGSDEARPTSNDGIAVRRRATEFLQMDGLAKRNAFLDRSWESAGKLAGGCSTHILRRLLPLTKELGTMLWEVEPKLGSPTDGPLQL